jgi:hypothetical protein
VIESSDVLPEESMRCGFLVTAALTFLLAGYALGRAQRIDGHTIDLGPVTLHLGMSRDATIGALSTYYSVNDLGMVTTKSGPPYESAGQVVFKSDKLSQVRKNWSPNNQEQRTNIRPEVFRSRPEIPFKFARSLLVDTARESQYEGQGNRGRAMYVPIMFLVAVACFIVYRPLPAHIGYLEFKHCYKNAFRTALEENFVYVEGYAVSNSDTPLLHAWNLDADAFVVDRTWNPHGRIYLGVVFPLSVVPRKSGKQYPVIDDWEHGYPILRKAWDGEAARKEAFDDVGRAEASPHRP